MAFKANASFLRFLSMGAAGVHQTMKILRRAGFEPIELERYCSSNKIWSTKIKRLRLPDLLCVKTGLRVEVRSKAKLMIRMSDTPSNPDRAWDAGLRDDDLVAFVACETRGSRPVPADEPVFLTIQALRSSVGLSTLGLPKSASEGAERDRTWPATVPTRDGTVVSVTSDRVVVRMNADRTRPERRQTYRLNGKTAYVGPGDTFKAHMGMICGAPPSLADLGSFLEREYDPISALDSTDAVDRYAAVRTLFRCDDMGARRRITVLEKIIERESDERVVLESAGVTASLGSAHGEDLLAGFIWSNEGRPDLRMEAVFILTELGNTRFAREQLTDIAASARFQDDELRQAAVWGLGKCGLRRHGDLLGFIDDRDDDVALHAIAGFDSDTPSHIITRLVSDLAAGGERRPAAASAALAVIGSDEVITELAAVAKTTANDWVLATLGRMPSDRVRQLLADDSLLPRIAPLLLTADDAHWLATEEKRTDLRFLLAQNIT